MNPNMIQGMWNFGMNGRLAMAMRAGAFLLAARGPCAEPIRAVRIEKEKGVR